jgi:transposase
MQTITTVGLDIAKSVFLVHGVYAEGQVVIRRQLKRRYVVAFFQKLPPCLVGIEACASSHHWSRELQALGHSVRLMPPAYVKPYVKRQKNDATDAEAICEAVTRANMRFVETKTSEQQSGLVLHRTRHLFIRQQTALINAIRAHLAEFGIVAPVGRNGVEELLDVVADPSDKRVPAIARACLIALGAQLRRFKQQILEFDRMIMAWHRSNEASKRLDAMPGVGPILATALVASAGYRAAIYCFGTKATWQTYARVSAPAHKTDVTYGNGRCPRGRANIEHSGFQTMLTGTNLNDFNGLPQTTNLGVRSSNLFGRATAPLSLRIT